CKLILAFFRDRSTEETRREEEGADLSSMGNCKSLSRALLGKAHVAPDAEWRMQDFGKTHVPDLEWRIHDFSSLLETGAKSATSAIFHCSGYNWLLQVIPMHKETGSETPYVALRLMTTQERMVPGHTVHVVFELSVYNHTKGMYCGCKASYNFHFKNSYSKEHCLIPLQELLKSSAFLVDDSCVFGVDILKIDVSSPEKKAVVVQKKATTVQNLFVQKKGFVKGKYTWNINNFLELDMDNFVRSPTFEVGVHKWYAPVTSQMIYINGTSACIRMVTSTALIASACTYAWVRRMSSVSSPRRCL
uniref:MATH domain-containing protein n=3 Tax=Aegilops tauschii subsp. strangulata TaxID=200361 RepID=A0A452YEP4_AEGTS